MNRLATVAKHLRQQPLQKAIPTATSTASYTHNIPFIRPFSNSERRMPTYSGSCFCRAIAYELSLASPDDARTSLCHCTNCKKAFGTNYGLTAKVQKDSLRITAGAPKEHVADIGSGIPIHREFCGTCGSFILEYGEPAKDHFRYICVGSLDDPEALPPKGEFFCSQRASWMPEVPNVFHKREIKE